MKNRHAHTEYVLGQIYFPDWAVLFLLKGADCAYNPGNLLKIHPLCPFALSREKIRGRI